MDLPGQATRGITLEIFTRSCTSWYETLRAASKRISLLNGYKTLHDLFQQLENCYACIDQIRRRLPGDADAWAYVGYHAREVQTLGDALLECAERISAAERNASWTGKLNRAQLDLNAAVQQRDIEHLADTTRLLGAVLGREPSRANVRLLAAARELQLGGMIQAFQSWWIDLERTMSADLSAHPYATLKRSIDRLTQLTDDLESLVVRHDAFQEVDDELRRIDEVLDRDIDELVYAWSDLKAMIKRACSQSAADWTSRLAVLTEELEQALGARDRGQVRDLFLECRGLINRGFNRIDWDLRRRCDALGEVGMELTATLGMIA